MSGVKIKILGVEASFYKIACPDYSEPPIGLHLGRNHLIDDDEISDLLEKGLISRAYGRGGAFVRGAWFYYYPKDKT